MISKKELEQLREANEFLTELSEIAKLMPYIEDTLNGVVNDHGDQQE